MDRIAGTLPSYFKVTIKDFLGPSEDSFTPAIKPSRSNTLAMEYLIREAGTFIVSSPAAYALRMRVRKSLIGSVYIGLPARFGHTGQFATVSQFAETDTTDSEVAHKTMLTTAAPATANFAGRVLGFTERLGDLRLSSHRLVVEWETESAQERVTALAGSGRGRHGDLEAVDAFNFIRSDFRKREVLTEADRKVATIIDTLLGNAAEVADTREGELRKARQKIPHALATKRHHHSHNHSFTNFKARDGLLGLGLDRLLSADAKQCLLNRIKNLWVLNTLGQSDRNRNRRDLWYGHTILDPELLGKSWDNLLIVAFLECHRLGVLTRLRVAHRFTVRANGLNIGGMNRHSKFNHLAFVLTATRAHVALSHVHTLDHDTVKFRERLHDLPLLTLVLPGNDDDFVTGFDLEFGHT